MFSSIVYHLICVIFLQYNLRSCAADIPLPPFLVVYSPGEPEYTDVLVKQVHDNLTLVCELRGDTSPRAYVWNYMPADGIAGVRSIERSVDLMSSSKLTRQDLQLSDSGQYMCSAPPFSVSKYILVQTKGPQCARGAFWCGSRCVLAAYVCDGRRDCVHGEDEDVSMCEAHVCARSDKLNCSSGRCISEAACCRGPSSLCRQPTCCDEHPRYSRLEGYVDVEYPPLFEDRHAPDDYGFIQSTIYTVTACALIFMIAVVLLVSAICKMHMKRAALRSYAHADRATRHHYNLQYAQAHRFPPCYEASRLLEQEGRVVVTSPTHSPIDSPVRQPLQCNPACPPSPPAEAPPAAETRAGFGLARLSSIFSSRYRQVPTQCADVEMTNVRSTSLNNSPTRNRTLDNYRSPTYCDLNTAEFIFTNPETGDCGRDLNYMATPVEFFRQRTMRRNTLERVMNQLDRQRLTLQLGRFQFSIPRFGRRNSTEPRPDTPNVAEINIDDLDFVRLNSNDTYTLNGRTIRLLGANFENYPVMPDGSIRPPSYTEAVRYKLYGPPPEYLSREGLNSDRGVDRVDEEARSNVEMPPCYEDLASGGNGNNSSINNVLNSNVVTVADSMNNGEVAANNNNSGDSVLNSSFVNHPNIDGDNIIYSPVTSLNNNSIVGTHNTPVIRNPTLNSTSPDYNDNGNRANSLDGNNGNGRETISSIIDNLPAIDSDVNANDSVTGMEVNNATNNRVICNNE